MKSPSFDEDTGIEVESRVATVARRRAGESSTHTYSHAPQWQIARKAEKARSPVPARAASREAERETNEHSLMSRKSLRCFMAGGHLLQTITEKREQSSA